MSLTKFFSDFSDCKFFLSCIAPKYITEFELKNLTSTNQLLQSTLEIFSTEAAPLGLQVIWAKTKVKSLSDYLPQPDPLTIEGQSVESVDSFV